MHRNAKISTTRSLKRKVREIYKDGKNIKLTADDLIVDSSCFASVILLATLIFEDHALSSLNLLKAIVIQAN